MNDPLPDKTPALIVGGGPVGLMAALLLARQGVPSVIVERAAARSPAPRAHALNPRSMEICRASGLDMAAIDAKRTPGVESGYVRFVSRLAGEEIGALPYERQDEAVLALTPTPLINIAQPDFEDILLAEVARTPAIAMRRGAEWRQSSDRDDGVESLVRLDDGTTAAIRSEYLIACDGAGSRVRASLGIGMEGERTVQHSVSIHFSADVRPLVKDRPAILYWMLDPAVSGTIIVYNLAENFVFIHAYDPNIEPLESFTPRRCRELVAEAIGDPSVEIVVHAANPWIMAAQVAERYRAGRIFLAGDAAHRFPPTGGLGLNTGIGDAHNLAWKIAGARRGLYDARVLDSYEAERKPVALANTAQSLVNNRQVARLFESVSGVRRGARPVHTFRERMADPAARAGVMEAIAAQREHFDSLGLQLGYVYGEGGQPPEDVSAFTPAFRRGARLPHGWVRRAGESVSTPDLLDDRAFTLLVASGARPPPPAAAPLRVVELGVDFTDPDGAWSRASGLAAGDAVLARPDGHIAFCGAAAGMDLAETLRSPGIFPR